MGGYSKRWETLAAKNKAYYLAHPELEVTCWLCHYPIDLYLQHNHRLSFTLDHIIPKILGGEDIQENTMPAHRACNSLRARQTDRWIAQRVMHGHMGLIKSTREW